MEHTAAPNPWEAEPTSIRSRDWRLQAITHTTSPTVGPTGTLHPTGTIVQAAAFLNVGGRTIDFALPSPIAMYLGLAAEAELTARKALRSAIPGRATQPRKGTPPNMVRREPILFDGLQHRIAAITFAYTALEAFANSMLPLPFSMALFDVKLGRPVERDRGWIERYVPIGDKLHLILPALSGVISPKGTGTWQRFIWMAKLRDRLIHLKESHWRRLGPDESDKAIWNHLISKEAHLAPWYARNLIHHYLAATEPRWLYKFSQRYIQDFTTRTI